MGHILCLGAGNSTSVFGNSVALGALGGGACVAIGITGVGNDLVSVVAEVQAAANNANVNTPSVDINTSLITPSSFRPLRQCCLS